MGDSEGLLCKSLASDCSLCTIVSVPFYLRNVAYGDTISTTDNPAQYLNFKEVVKRGGYSIYRILLHDSSKSVRRPREFGMEGEAVETPSTVLTSITGFVAPG